MCCLARRVGVSFDGSVAVASSYTTARARSGSASEGRASSACSGLLYSLVPRRRARRADDADRLTPPVGTELPRARCRGGQRRTGRSEVGGCCDRPATMNSDVLDRCCTSPPALDDASSFCFVTRPCDKLMYGGSGVEAGASDAGERDPSRGLDQALEFLLARVRRMYVPG